MKRAPREIVVGRSRGCELFLDDPTVSGRHVRLSWDRGRILVEDLGSANGTFLEGIRIQTARVRPGDDLRLGRARLAWDAPELESFLRAAGAHQVAQGLVIGGRRAFICGQCGGRALMPKRMNGGLVICPSCKTTLAVDEPASAFGQKLLIGLSVLSIVLLAIALSRSFAPNEGRTLAASPVGAKVVDQIVSAADVASSETRNRAAMLAADQQGPFRIEQVAEVWRNIRGEWRYVNDPRGRDYFATASETIANGYVGDCDDFAIVLVSMIEAIGGRARIVIAEGEDEGHAYAEACLPLEAQDARRRLDRYYKKFGKRVMRVHYRPGKSDACGLWLNLDWNAPVPGGPYRKEKRATAVYLDGRVEVLAASR